MPNFITPSYKLSQNQKIYSPNNSLHYPYFKHDFKKISYGGASSISFLSQYPLFVPSPLKAGLSTAIGAAFSQPFNPMKQKIPSIP
jgi:hypothetical protein